MSAVAESKEAHIRQFIEDKIERLEKAYRDADVLCYFYRDNELSTYEVAEILGTSQGTISNWLNKTGLGARDSSEMNRVKRATFTPVDSSGHERWNVTDPEGSKTVSVHQLLAVADGADPEDVWAEDTHVHHRTGIPWLNIEGGVEVLTAEEHRAVHREGEWTEEDGIPVLEVEE